MLASFYTETGGLDISNVFLISRISEGSSWDGNFSRRSPVVDKFICTLCGNIILEALKAKINTTVHEQLKDKFRQNQINEFFTLIIPPGIGNISISVTFDMGWLKKETGRN